MCSCNSTNNTVGLYIVMSFLLIKIESCFFFSLFGFVYFVFLTLVTFNGVGSAEGVFCKNQYK